MRGVDATSGRALDGIEHLRQSLRDLLTTPIGSRVMRRDYGSRLFDLVDAPQNRETVQDVIAATAEAIIRWEPRLSLQRVVVQAFARGRITLTISGTYIPTGSPVAIDGIVVP